VIADTSVAGSVDDLLAGARGRAAITQAVGTSGAGFERVDVGGRAHVLKYLTVDRDWTMQAAGNLVPTTLTLWRRGIFARLPACLNHAVAGVAADGPRGCAVLMPDVGAWLVPLTDDPVDVGTHLRFLDHMAAMHAAFWDAGPECELLTPMGRYLLLSPWTAQAAAAVGSDHLIPRLIDQGWARLADVAPRASALLAPLARDPAALVTALEPTPRTLLHGDWKLDNLGTDPDGRTVLLDWEFAGRGPALADLAWYLSINCRRLPQSKEDAIAAYRDALERHGIDTAFWWERQLALCLLGAAVQFGWEKAFNGYDEELVWWEARALEGARLLA
jgi:hypothetical protein